MDEDYNTIQSCFSTLDERLTGIWAMEDLVNPISNDVIIAHLTSTIWNFDLRQSRDLLSDSLQEIDSIIEKFPGMLELAGEFYDVFNRQVHHNEILEKTIKDLTDLKSRLLTVLNKIERKYKATLPNGIEKDGYLIKTHATAETLVAFFKELRTKNIVIDQDLPNIELAKFIAANFSTQKSKDSGLTINHLEDLISCDSTSASQAFIMSLKKVIKKLEG